MPGLITQLLERADKLGNRPATTAAIGANRREHPDDEAAQAEWLEKQIARFDTALKNAQEAVTSS